jgi:hypothetical protein
MRSGLGQVQERALVRPTPEPMAPPAVAPTKEIPYDYVATFTLRGENGNRVQDVINISIEAPFIATEIGYSFIPAQQLPLREIPFTQGGVDLAAAGFPVRTSPTTLVRIIADTIAARLVLPSNADNQNVVRDLASEQLATIIEPLVDPRQFLQCLLVKLCGIDFRYTIIDSGTGRELQNLAIHNIAGLGKADGDRPFRPLAKPMLFMPRSTIRIEVEEISEGRIYGFDERDAAGRILRRVTSQLFIVLHGYKILGYYGYGTAAP